MGSKERTKGHNYERKLAKEFRELGYSEAKTSRYTSKEMDDLKVDLTGIPFYLQAKAVQSSIQYSKLIAEIKKNLENKEYHPVLIFHKRGRKENEELVIMTKKDFYILLSKFS